MKNINSEDIFQLIFSMASSEKSYFRKYASRHVKGEKNDYMKLFEVFEHEKVFEQVHVEDRIRKLRIKNVSRLKNYLYRTILKSLASYHAGHSVDAEIRDDLDMAEVLWSRSMYEACGKLLIRIRKNVIKYDKKIFLTELLDWEAKLIARQSPTHLAFKALLDNREEAIGNLRSLVAETEYNFLGRSFSLTFQSSGQNQVKYHPAFTTGVDKYLLQAREDEFGEGNTRIAYYRTDILKNISLANYGEAKLLTKKLLSYMAANENYIIANVFRYVLIVINSILLNCEIGDYLEATNSIEILRQVSVRYRKYCSEMLQKSIEVDLYTQTLNLWILAGDNQNLHAFLASRNVDEEFHTRHFSSDTQEAVYHLCMARAYFELGNNKTALRWLYQLINEKRFESCYLYPNALIFELIIHYELHHIELVDSRLRSLKRYFGRKKNSYKLSVLNVISKLVAHDNVSLSPSFEQELKKNHDLLYNFAKFDIKRWLDSKVPKR